MLILLLLALALVSTSCVLVLRLFAAPRSRAVRTIEQIDGYGFDARLPASPRHSQRARRRLDDLAALLGSFLATHVKSFREEEIRGHLRAAGFYTTNPRKFLGYRLLAALLLPALWLWVATSGGFGPARTLLGVVVGVGTGWIMPMFLLKRRGRARLDQIDYEMPELIDLLVTTVEAGVGFSGSLRMAARQFQGPLGDELRLTLQEQSMGLATDEALANMLERANTPAMRSFVRSILQGETLGVSIGKIMRDLATEMRKRRRQRAEERAQKAPTKMLFPLVLLMFPAMFVVLLGPAIMQIAHSLGGVK